MKRDCGSEEASSSASGVMDREKGPPCSGGVGGLHEGRVGLGGSPRTAAPLGYSSRAVRLFIRCDAARVAAQGARDALAAAGEPLAHVLGGRVQKLGDLGGAVALPVVQGDGQRAALAGGGDKDAEGGFGVACGCSSGGLVAAPRLAQRGVQPLFVHGL